MEGGKKASLRSARVSKELLQNLKSAYIPREGGKSTYDVVPFMEVYNKSLCRPREMLVEIQQEYPDDIEHIFIPSCVVLTRCAGCCNDEMMECTPTITYNITLEIKRVKPLRQQTDFFMSFAEHSECQCRLKKDLPEKREKKPRKGKGQKRKRKKNREKKRDLTIILTLGLSSLTYEKDCVRFVFLIHCCEFGLVMLRELCRTALRKSKSLFTLVLLPVIGKLNVFQ
ncbi:vascular endothelial growth factor Ab isoform X6 [Ctenopharyngodon idella]|uniref:vascular endothelial growth factor Ab isoform X6 n=1 Tax=Ctenopharyngodon idella TaxID=7959 RepID=UPI00222FDAFE|nr:vascular endothelial growth factor Ab isoform X6 [Ctenopharyngodon idella]